MEQSKRQERKAERASKKDKNGISMMFSRPVRRAMQRINRRMSAYEAAPISKESGHQFTRPGKTECY